VSRVALILGVRGAEPTTARRRLRAEREAYPALGSARSLGTPVGIVAPSVSPMRHSLLRRARRQSRLKLAIRSPPTRSYVPSKSARLRVVQRARYIGRASAALPSSSIKRSNAISGRLRLRRLWWSRRHERARPTTVACDDGACRTENLHRRGLCRPNAPAHTRRRLKRHYESP
jgi:hypothetical protein